MTRILATILCLAALTGAASACTVPANGAAMVSAVTQGTDAYRRDSGRSGVSESAALNQAAQAQACWMAQTGQIGHTGQGGSSVADRVGQVGYAWGFLAENVAMGHNSPSMVLQGWVNSAGHRRNLLNRKAREVGVGVAEQGGRLYWAMVLGAAR